MAHVGTAASAVRGAKLRIGTRVTLQALTILNASGENQRQSISAGILSEANMPFDLQQTIALLSRTPSSLNALLRDLPPSWTNSNEGPKTWSPFDIVGHLIHGERTDWMPRARMILEQGESRAFDPFDRLAQERESQGKSLPELLDEFAQLRSENLDALRGMNLQPEDFNRRGRHPALGVVTLSQLLATWTLHDLTHLHQLSRVMAYQYREVVGPWIAYLGVLHCQGHSS